MPKKKIETASEEEIEPEEELRKDAEKEPILSPTHVKALQIMSFFDELGVLDPTEPFDPKNTDQLIVYAYEVGKRKLWGG